MREDSFMAIGYIMVAKAMTRFFIISEIFFVWSFVGLTVLFANIYGLLGIRIVFIANYFILRRYVNGECNEKQYSFSS